MDILQNRKIENPLRTIANEIIQNTKQTNEIENIIINHKDSNIPINLPIAIVGDKGSGKTTLIKSLIEASSRDHIFNNIYFIYSSTTFSSILPSEVVKVDVNECEQFLSMLFETKSIFNSYYRFFKSLDFKELNRKYETNSLKEEDITSRLDNNIIKYNKSLINSNVSPQVKIDKIFNTGEKILETFSKPFNIGTVRVNGFRFNDRDAVIIDDIAIASKMLFVSIRDNDFYEYLTLTRHMRLFVCLSGQQIEQIPKTIRREIMCWILSKNTNIELLQGVLQKYSIKQIQKEQQKLNKYEFVIYNVSSGSVSVL